MQYGIRRQREHLSSKNGISILHSSLIDLKRMHINLKNGRSMCMRNIQIVAVSVMIIKQKWIIEYMAII